MCRKLCWHRASPPSELGVNTRGRKNDDWMWSWIGLHFAITSKTKLIARVWRHQSNQKLDWIAFLLDCKSNHACAIKCNQKCNIFTSDCAIKTKMIAQAEKNDCNPKWGRKINKFWISKSGQYIFDWWVIKCQYNFLLLKWLIKIRSIYNKSTLIVVGELWAINYGSPQDSNLRYDLSQTGKSSLLN